MLMKITCLDFVSNALKRLIRSAKGTGTENEKNTFTDKLKRVK